MILHEHRRIQSLGEEVANSISHGIGLVAVIVAAPFMILKAARQSHPGFLVGVSIFSATLVLLYLASTLYHALPPGRAKHAFRVLEHSAIFLMIAGTYTPFTLGILRGPWGWTIFGIIWGLAAAGIALKLMGRVKHVVLSSAIYVAMGWTIVVASRPMIDRMQPAGLIWVVLGGLAYTVGTLFFAAHNVRYGHFIWHLFVMAGTAFHVAAVMLYGA